MVMQRVEQKGQRSQQFHVRKLTKSGNSRYLSVGALIPIGWQAVKVYVEQLDKEVCVLRIVQIK